jgi:hypothetical protein
MQQLNNKNWLKIMGELLVEMVGMRVEWVVAGMATGMY